MTDLPADPHPADGIESVDEITAPGGFDMGSLLEQAMEMQQQLLAAQATAAEAVIEGHAGGGAVTVRVTGGLVFQSVTIAPEAVDPDEIDLLQDLILAALHDATDQIAQLQQASMGGLDLGAMGGALGLGGGSELDEDDEYDEDDEDDEYDDDDGDEEDGSA
jgi:nucleoid-associated protein EbfC